LHKEESRSIGWSAVVDPFVAVRKSDIRARVQHLNKISNGDALALAISNTSTTAHSTSSRSDTVYQFLMGGFEIHDWATRRHFTKQWGREWYVANVS
jgi:hypothetical protein